MAHTAHAGGVDRRWGAYDQRLWREERRSRTGSQGANGDATRGREADSPLGIGGHGWRDTLLRVKERMRRDRLSIIAAGVAFYGLLALFPTLAAMVAIYGLVADARQVESQVAALSALLPPEAAKLITAQLHDLLASDRTALSFGAAGSLLLALWSASKGVRTLMEALNVAYDEREKRGKVAFFGVALLLTLGAIVGAALLVGLIVALPLAARLVAPDSVAATVVALARWPLVALAMVAGLAVAYRYGPSREAPRWNWVSAGAVIATLLWIAGSALFSLYVTKFGNYNETYGSMGAVVILLTWFLLSAYSVLLGAETNAELERQTRRDTTAGQRKPMGARGAHAADTVGRSP